ncbi:synaptonemal complex central element protein 1-like [Cervus elaphus]|uniref:synaptonemal complex central element protein 1-like n=1 Tax=Cervus elaphus TaxID=9860 RepID=UPI001CC29331|nr:synaptonemal complex central element protein 1-like [Cervus elaphus]
MVKKLQKEGSLEPQIEDLINRIHELQQAKEKSSEELGEAQALWEALRQDLDSLSGEKVHLEEVLSRKQEALRTLQLHCQRKAEEAQRNYVLAEHTEQISIQNSQVTESQGPRKLGLPMEEQLEDLIGPHKDLWEFHMLKRRLAWEIRALQSSQEQLLTEGGTWARGGGGAGTARGSPGTAHNAPPAPREAGAGPAGRRGAAAARAARGPRRPGGDRRAEGGARETRRGGPRPDPEHPRGPGRRWRGLTPDPRPSRPASSSPVRATWRRRRSWSRCSTRPHLPSSSPGNKGHVCGPCSSSAGSVCAPGSLRVGVGVVLRSSLRRRGRGGQAAWAGPRRTPPTSPLAGSGRLSSAKARDGSVSD